MKRCPTCDSLIEGRRNKRFCTPGCRAAAARQGLVRRVEALEKEVAYLKAMVLKDTRGGVLLSESSQERELSQDTDG